MPSVEHKDLCAWPFAKRDCPEATCRAPRDHRATCFVSSLERFLCTNSANTLFCDVIQWLERRP